MGWREVLRLARTQPAPAIAEKAPPAPADPPWAPTLKRSTGVLAELGITGTVNYDGRIQAEPNQQLRDENARGRAGVANSWGEWERIRNTDPAVQSALNVIVAPLREASVEVEPGAEGAEYELHAEFVKDNLLKWMDPQWAGFIEAHVPGFLTNGFDIHEPVLGTREDPRVPGGTAVYLRKLAQRLPSSLSPNPWREKNGELECVVQAGMRTGESGQQRYEAEIRLPADRILLTTWQRSGNNYEGRSAFRSVWFLAKVREALLKIFAIGSEREALGVPVASVDKDAPVTKEQLQEFQNFLQSIAAHEHAAAVAPKGVDLQWLFSPVSNKGHVLDGWERLGKAIHQVVQTQQVTLGVDGTGARAVGEVHDGTKNDFVTGVKALLEATLNGVGERPYTGIPRRIIEPNFGPQKAYPVIKLVMKRREVTAGELASGIPPLIAAGAVTWRHEDENVLREKFGLAPISVEERQGELDRKAQQALEIAGATKPTDDEGEPDDDSDPKPPEGGGPEPKDDEAKPEKKPAKLSARGNPGSPWKRALFAWEQHLDLANIEGFLDREKKRFAQTVQDLITAMVAKAVPQVREAMKDGDPSDLLDVQLDTSALGAFFGEFLELHRAEGYRQVRREMARAKAVLRKRQQGQVGMSHRLAEEDEREDDRGAAPDYDDAPADDFEPDTRPVNPEGRRRVATLIEAQRQTLLRRVRSRVIDDMVSEAQYLVRTGGAPEEIVQRVVTTALETRGLKFDAGSVQTTSFNLGREQFAEERGDQVESVRYSAILDGNQCTACDGMDGKEFRFNSPEHDAAVPPYQNCKGGESCRCIIVYLFNDVGDDGFRTVEEAPE